MDLADSMDSQLTSDQLNSHPSHDLPDAAYPRSDYQPLPAGASSQRGNTAGQDSKPYLPEEPLVLSNSLRDAAYTDSDNKPVAGHSSSTDSSVRLASHQIQNPANPDSCYIPDRGNLPSAGEPTAQTSRAIDSASASGLLDDVSSLFDGLVPPPPTYQPGEDSAYLLSGGDAQHISSRTSN
ncbi:hypothetical protein BBO_06170 [Beauveria brongniartii RCEF 3172]|uniref:Uncharacterized protein n=1 Tax=Beauveria brongniartii RCEF 3172 TaxID=1081107 RepID=A0A167BJN7_9HYPO|nr:hypothetical protein BBO_06170 [Beauveria brongniartii RCEF 3172]